MEAVVSRCGSVTSGSESPPDSHSTPSVSLRYYGDGKEKTIEEYQKTSDMRCGLRIPLSNLKNEKLKVRGWYTIFSLMFAFSEPSMRGNSALEVFLF